MVAEGIEPATTHYKSDATHWPKPAVDAPYGSILPTSQYPFYDNWKLLKKESTKSIFNLKYKLREYVDEKLMKSFLKNDKGIEFGPNHYLQKNHFKTEQEQIK